MRVESKKISFNKKECDFISVLRERVNSYFKNRRLSHKANAFMYVKSIFWMSLVAMTYTAILSALGGGLTTLGLFILLGFFISVGTMNISHDALHGAYASNPKVNRLLGFFMDLFGASSFYWKKEHVVDHHTFTNIIHHDADLDVPILLRVCPEAPRHSFHRFQHIYAPFLYALNLMKWVYFSDFRRMYRVVKSWGKDPKNPSAFEFFMMASFKCVHIFLFIALPIMVLPLMWWQTLLCYLAYLATAGVTLTTVFQLAHIVDGVSFPLPDEEGNMEENFVKHQLATTSNFATHNPVVKFFFGGLNFQVEHHIFPQYCHIHLSKISPIVERTAKEFGIPYYKQPSFIAAVRSHFRILREFGRR